MPQTRDAQSQAAQRSQEGTLPVLSPLRGPAGGLPQGPGTLTNIPLQLSHMGLTLVNCAQTAQQTTPACHHDVTGDPGALH